MKPLEKIFFQACVMKCLLHDEYYISFRKITNVFCALGFPQKRLLYYIRKWDDIGFYDYGVTLDLGWFDPDKFTGEYKVMYEEILAKGGGKDGRNL